MTFRFEEAEYASHAVRRDAVDKYAGVVDVGAQARRLLGAMLRKMRFVMRR